MKSRHLLLSALAIAVALTTAPLPAQTPPANPELAGLLARELGATPEQVEGAAGALFDLAKTRLKTEEWSRVASSVPGMEGLLRAAPAPAAGVTDTMARAIPGAASLGGLSSVADAFSKLGLKPELAAKAAQVLTDYVGRTGGVDVGNLLAGALR